MLLWTHLFVVEPYALFMREHITPVLQSLHWLSVRYRIDFEALLLLFMSLNGLAPSFLSELLIDHHPVQALRSDNQRLLGPVYT